MLIDLTKRETEHNKTKQTKNKKNKSNSPLCNFCCVVQKAESKILFNTEPTEKAFKHICLSNIKQKSS